MTRDLDFYESQYGRIHVAFAPPGKWTNGPTVISDLHNEDVINQYREMDYTVLGPYTLENRAIDWTDRDIDELAET